MFQCAGLTAQFCSAQRDSSREGCHTDPSVRGDKARRLKALELSNLEGSLLIGWYRLGSYLQSFRIRWWRIRILIAACATQIGYEMPSLLSSLIEKYVSELGYLGMLKRS